MSAPVATGLTYDDLCDYPQDDGLRRELIDGELFVSPSPIRRHQDALAVLVEAMLAYRREHGGKVYFAPMDVRFAADTVVEPDLLFIGVERVDQLRDPRFVDVVPDLLVEVSSPQTRRLDLIKKRALYEREGVPEFWFVDLDVATESGSQDEIVVDVYRLDDRDHYGEPTTLAGRDTLTCLAAPGFELPVADVLV